MYFDLTPTSLLDLWTRPYEIVRQTLFDTISSREKRMVVVDLDKMPLENFHEWQDWKGRASILLKCGDDASCFVLVILGYQCIVCWSRQTLNDRACYSGHNVKHVCKAIRGDQPSFETTPTLKKKYFPCKRSGRGQSVHYKRL